MASLFDNFKFINDSKGHTVGDMTLIQIADRLKSVVKKKDTIGRVGNDEFVIILEDINDFIRQISGKPL